MKVTFEIYAHPIQGTKAVKRGFSWPAFFFTWVWAFFKRMWLAGGVLLLLSTGLTLLSLELVQVAPVFFACLGLAFQLIVGLNGNSWLVKALEYRGFGYLCSIPATSPADALAKLTTVGGSIPEAWKARLPYSTCSLVPTKLQGIVAIAVLTWKAAFRFKLFLVMAVLLLAAVVGLPMLIKDDGTARGFTQILLTYTLSVITAFLGLSTLWLACGTLARDVEECQIQMVAVKPIARWQIWLGKWLGIMSLNAVLLALAGGSVYGLLQWRATKLPPEQQAILRNEVLVARASVKEESLDQEIESQAEQLLQERLKKNPVSKADILEVRKQIREQVRAQFQVVPPGGYRPWFIDLGLAKNSLRGQPLYLRVKFNAADKSPSGTFRALWQVGVPETPRIWRDQMSLAPETFHEFEIPANLFDEKGVLTILFLNPNDAALLFPLEDGLEVLYRQGGFGLNYIRGLGIIFCWMALLATLGLASASFLSFPVAAFLSLGILTIGLSSGTLSNAVTEGTLMGYNEEAGTSGHSVIDIVAIPVFRALLKLINLVKEFSPIDALSTGRSIPWGLLGLAVAQIVLLLCGIVGLIGIIIFNRRELATAQGTQ